MLSLLSQLVVVAVGAAVLGLTEALVVVAVPFPMLTTYLLALERH
jgi:hypothetical protein